MVDQTFDQELEAITREWVESGYLHEGDLFVIGCSTSEVAGEKIGTAGTEEIAATIFHGLKKLQEQTKIQLAFQCCEHLNRALVVERQTAKVYHLEEVSVVPVPKAGGSMASFAYKQLNDPVVVERVQADAGIDIGETMIGMHLKPVAVPLRFTNRFIGNARANVARTRPKLIGGERAQYKPIDTNQQCT
ncbi:TIGR01440 family protein [Oceanobacillus halotolerans]|uniref:TIGR01440 family protein n=1 Tax=Oceanobacillus halotolerans TaxID=2663380 RepID=UPI001CF7E2CE|nr:TIGR01440 family protein [Oceanobacillus halotolerans]